MRPLTQQKLKVLLKNTIAFYAPDGKEPAGGIVITNKELFAMYHKEKDHTIYPVSSIIIKDPKYKVARGKVLITMKDNVEELRDAQIAMIAAGRQNKVHLGKDGLPLQARGKGGKFVKSDDLLPKGVRTNALALAKTIASIPDENSEEIPRFKTDREVANEVAMRGDASHPYDHVSRDDIEDAFGGSDINEVISGIVH